MTNAVDILLVDGPATSRVICANKPLTTNYDVIVGDQTHTYVHSVYESELLGGKYHIASQDEIDPAFVDGLIVMTNFPAGWDL